MAVNFNDILSSFEKIEKYAIRETSFDVGDGNGKVNIRLRHLTESEETEIQKAVYESIEEGINTVAQQQVFIHNMKIKTLSRAIVEIDGIDLRSGYIDCVGENGEKEIREKNDIISVFLEKWPKPYISRIFAKYGDLISEVEIEAEKSVQYNPVDIEAEINRLLAKVEEFRELKKIQDERIQERSNKVMNVVHDINNLETNINRKMAEPSPRVKEKEVGASESNDGPDLDYDERAEFERTQEEKQKTASLEEKRLASTPAEVVRREKEEMNRNESSVAPIRPQVKAPPQGSISNYGNPPPSPMKPGSEISPMGTVLSPGGKEIEVYGTPTQTLSSRGMKNNDPGKPVINKPASSGNVNPNFNPRRG